MLLRKMSGLGLFLGLLLSIPAYADHAADQPELVIKNAAEHVIELLNKEGETLKNDREKLLQMINDIVLPYFDFEKMSYYVLGKYWKEASPEQQGRFVAEFKHLLVRTYATALEDYKDQEIVYLPVKLSSAGDNAIVPTEIKQPGGTPISVMYRVYYDKTSWRIYDVAIGGVSLVTNYRANFAGEIRKGGLDGLIESLEAHNKPASPQAASPQSALAGSGTAELSQNSR